MAEQAKCAVWRPMDCEGTTSCPPRCPRYVAPDGTAYTVYRYEEFPGELPERTDSGSVDDPDPGSVDDLGLVAVQGDDVVGWTCRDEKGTSVHVRADASRFVGVELVRQVVAAGVARDAGSLVVRAPESVAAAVREELAGAVRPRGDPGDALVVDLDAEAATRTTRHPDDDSGVAVDRDLDPLFEPETVAVLGATDREGAIGRAVVENLQASFRGTVVPVTRSADAVLGVPAVDDVADADADLAVVVLPADAAVDAVQAAGAAGVDAAVVLSAGFGETDDDGVRRERALREAADANDVALVGPNALGVLSTRRSMNASFGPELPDAGGVSVLSHSGAMVTATLDWAAANDVGVRDVVSLGNGAGVDEADVLRYWGADAATDVVFAYLEDVQDGERFVAAARAVSRSTPVVVLKAGRSEAGASAAASHTGALVGDDAGFEAAFDAAGVVRASSQEHAYDVLQAFARQPALRGDRVAVVTNAGGPGVLATDAVANANLSLASLSAGTRDRLREALPAAASVDNPLDVLGDASVERFVAALEVVLADDGVDGALVASTPHPLVDHADLVEAVGDAGRRYGKPVATCFSGGPPDPAVASAFSSAGVPNYPDAERAASAFAALSAHGERKRRPRVDPVPVERESGRVASVLDQTVTEGRETLGVDALALLDAYGVTTPEGVLVESPTAAASATAELDGPFALKVASPDLAHKSDVGGVRVDVPAHEVEAAAADVLESVREAAPSATLSGVFVQELAPEGVECVAGITRHPRFGPVLTFGLGGVFVEHVDDVVHALAPVSHARACELVGEIEAAGVLEGARDRQAVDVDALADALVALSWLAVDHPRLTEFEVNPLVATALGAYAVDFHGRLRSDASGAVRSARPGVASESQDGTGEDGREASME